MLEPRATAIALLVVGIVLAACVLSTRLAARTGSVFSPSLLSNGSPEPAKNREFHISVG